MKFLQHGSDFVGGMRGDIDAGGKAIPGSAENYDRDFWSGFDLTESCREFVHHRNVNDVERRISQSDARNAFIDIEHYSVEFRYGLNGHMNFS
jgi:hypothetical protein